MADEVTAPSSSPSPHVLIFPLPVQGHVNSMLKLAHLLCLSNLKITFLTSADNHRRLLQFSDVISRFSSFESFRFATIPIEHPIVGEEVMDVFESLDRTARPYLKEILIGSGDDPVTVCVVDGVLLGLAREVAEEVGVPVVAFRTIGAACFWTYFCVPRVIDAGEVPFSEDKMDQLVQQVPGMETFLRRRDLPSFCRAKDSSDTVLQLLIRETQQTLQANSLILNTFEALEGPFISLIRAHCCNVYSVGPLHVHLKSELDQIDKTKSFKSSSNSLQEVDRSCITWLDQKPPKSVVYVSFGSITTLDRAQFMEFWAGMVESKRYFLWVIRPDLTIGENGTSSIPTEIVEGTKKRGCLVGWAPQEEVLAHPAIGGFLTHSGWNSTLESIAAGVPMVCWPYFADQQVNSRCVSELWKLGLDMKDMCDRVTVEKMINDLMEGKRDELAKSTSAMSRLATESITEGGSSNCNLNRLIQDIISMSREVSSK